jgi:hypothetical protein
MPTAEKVTPDRSRRTFPRVVGGLSRLLAFSSAVAVVFYAAFRSRGDQDTQNEERDRPEQRLKPQSVDDRLLTLQLAEYEAVMNRCNYLITLHRQCPWVGAEHTRVRRATSINGA